MSIIKEQNFQISYETTGNGYQNPLSPNMDTADPCIVYSEKDQYYYATYTGNKTLKLHRAKSLKDLFVNDESKIIYEANAADETYGYLWAPELHFIDGKWYLYTSTHQTETDKGFKHVIVLKAKTDDLWDGFELGGHINPNLLAIDPTIYQDKKNQKLYICFSVSYGPQKLAIQEMKSPTEPMGDYTIISEAIHPWELKEPYVGKSSINEGAYFVENDGRLFIVYSGNGCWSDDYVFGILECVGEDILSADSWVKDETPLMTKGNGNYGPGHATFFASPDKTELWMCYHCLHESDPEVVCMPRHCHCQKVFFDKTGFPHVNLPLPKGAIYRLPSGDSFLK